MKLLSATLPIVVVALFSLSAYSQDSVWAGIYTNKDKSVIRLDTMRLFNEQSPYLLPKGTYHLRAWAPGMQLYEDTIHLEKRFTMVKIKLKPTDAYRDYRNRLLWYRTKKLTYRYLFLPALIAYGTTTYFRYNREMNEAEQRMADHQGFVLESQANYDNAISAEDIERERGIFEINMRGYEYSVNRYNRLAKEARVQAAAVTAGAVLGTYLFIRSFALKRPTYSEVPLLSRVHINSDYKNSIYVSANFQF